MSGTTIYIGRENVIAKRLSFGKVFHDLSYVTKMELVKGTEVYADSDAHAEAFNWQTGNAGEVHLKVGELPMFTVGSHSVYLIVYDEDNDNGVNYGIVKIKVKGE